MLDFVSAETVCLYFLILSILIFVQYFSYARSTRPFNNFDVLYYQLFLIANFGAVIVVLAYLGFVSSKYLALYGFSFSALLLGIYVGSRLRLDVSKTTFGRGVSIFQPFCFITFFCLGIFIILTSAYVNFSTWQMEGDAHLNRIDVYRANAIFFYIASALAFSVNVYFMLAAVLAKSIMMRRCAVIYLVMAILVGLTGASRAGMMDFIFQLSAAVFILMSAHGLRRSNIRSNIFFILLLALFLASLFFVSLQKNDYSSALFSILERIVYSADNVVYFHVYLAELFEYKLDYSFQYFLHPFLKIFNSEVIEGGIGATMSADLSGEMTGRGPVASFIYDGMFVFGETTMAIYAFFVGIFLGGVRKYFSILAKSGLILKNPTLFFASTLYFSLCLVLVNDLLTFMVNVVVSLPFVFAFYCLSLMLKIRFRVAHHA